MKLTEPQKTIAQDPSRFKIVAAGRRFGKTFLSIRQMCYYARQPDRIIYYIAPTYRMAKTIVWDDIKARLTELNWTKKINESDMRIDLINGSKIFLRGSDNPDSLRGISCDYAVFDEYADMDPRTWEAVIRPALADRQGSAMFIGSPKGKNHLFDLYSWAKEQPDWGTYKYTTLEGGNVAPEEVEAAKSQMDERTFRQEFLADWVDYVGLVFYAFNEDHVKRFTDETPKTIHIGTDFNIDPGCSVIAAQYNWGLHIFDEIELRNSNTFEMADEIRKRYPNSRVIVYPDPAGSARKTSSVTTDHNILSNAGFTVHARRSHPPVKDRINAANSALSSGKILIDPRCKSLRECLTKLSYREGSNEPNKGVYDHMTDAWSYMVEYLYPLNKITPKRVEPVRWAVNAPPMRRFG